MNEQDNIFELTLMLEGSGAIINNIATQNVNTMQCTIDFFDVVFIIK